MTRIGAGTTATMAIAHIITDIMATMITHTIMEEDTTQNIIMETPITEIMADAIHTLTEEMETPTDMKITIVRINHKGV